MRKKIELNKTYITWVPVTNIGAEERKVNTLYDGALTAIVPSSELMISEVIIQSPLKDEHESLVVIPIDANYKEKVVVSIWDIYDSVDECEKSGGIKDLQGVYKIHEAKKILNMLNEELDRIAPGNELNMIYGELNNLYEDTIGRMD